MSKQNHIPLINNARASSGWENIDAGTYACGIECTTPNGASVTFQWSKEKDGTIAHDIDGAVFTATDIVSGIPLPAGFVKASLSGTPTTTVYAFIGSVD